MPMVTEVSPKVDRNRVVWVVEEQRENGEWYAPAELTYQTRDDARHGKNCWDTIWPHSGWRFRIVKYVPEQK